MNIDYLDTLANRALRKFGIKDCIAVFNKISENATYFVYNDSGVPIYTLRLSNEGSRSLQELEAELKWISSIGKEVSIIRPAVNEVVQVDGKYCVLFNYVSGHNPVIDNKNTMLAIGRLAAKLHSYSNVSLNRPMWTVNNMVGTRGLWGNWRENEDLSLGQINIIDNVIEDISSKINKYNTDKFGLIHNDLRIANIVKNRTYTAIDFDDCGYGYYMQDLASSLSFIEMRDDIERFKEYWIEGYETVASLTEEDKNMADYFIVIRRIQLLAWITTRQYNAYIRSITNYFAKDTVRIVRMFKEKYY